MIIAPTVEVDDYMPTVTVNQIVAHLEKHPSNRKRIVAWLALFESDERIQERA